jgi:biopolymer transport protein ExbD
VKKISQSHHSSLNELNITPLLDLAFVLLVIFIITTPQLSNDMEMNLPTPPPQNQPKPPTPPKIYRLDVEASGRITLNQQAIELAALKPTLVSLRETDPGVKVVFRGSGDAEYQKVVGVLDAIQQASITNVGLATETLQ